jgi:toxin CcdB
MAQFDVYRNPHPATAAQIPYFVDIQAECLDALSTRVVVPLARRDGYPAVSRLSPVFRIEGVELVFATAEMAAVYRHALGEPVGSLAAHREEMIAAIEFLIAGI